MEQKQNMHNPSSGPFILPSLNQFGRLDSSSYSKQLMFGYGIVLLVMQIVSLPGEVFLRRRFGERYLDPMMVFLGFGGVFAVGAAWAWGSTFAADDTSFSLLLFALLYLGAAFLHRIALFHLSLKGELWHSQSPGLAWAPLTIPARMVGEMAAFMVPVRLLGTGYRDRLRKLVAELIQLFVEPAVLWLLGMALIAMKSPVGLVLMWSGSAMLLKGILQHQSGRTRLLDQTDAAIEAEHRVEILTGRSTPEQTHGYRVTGVPLSGRARRMVDRAFRHRSQQPESEGFTVVREEGTSPTSI